MRIQGTIPSELGLLANLKQLWMDNNRFSGTIPDALYLQLTNLEHVWLENNALTGTISTKIWNWKQMKWLKLDENRLSGSIPTQIGFLKQLNSLELRLNQLEGTLPTELGRMTGLTQLDVQGNLLLGLLPSHLGDLTDLEALHVEQNKFGGPLPTELGRLVNLKYLSLYDNAFQGTVPQEYEALEQLENLSLEGTELQGNVDGIFCLAFRPLVIDYFWADCLEPSFVCSCCTTCCDDGSDCVDKGATFVVGSPRLEALLEYIGPVVSSNPDIFKDSTSPQYAALEWLADEDEWTQDMAIESIPVQIWVERYVLVLLYFSTDGASWENQFHFLTPTSVCEWNVPGETYDEEGVVCFDGVVSVSDLVPCK